MIRRYDDFKEVAEEIAKKTPTVIYKFRTWEDDYHKRIITEREAWFAHPHTLNDPYDVRPPYNFVVGNIDWDKARNRIREAGRFNAPSLSEHELEVEVDLRVQRMQVDPVGYFQENRGEYILEKKHYDQKGVFSCCKSAENEPMWAHYGNNHCGFAVGFKTVEAARTFGCTVGHVNYDDTPVDYHIFGANDYEKIMECEIFQKGKRWEQEEELRFFTAGIGKVRERASQFPPEAVAEIVFGLNTSQQVQDEIMATASVTFPGIPFYRLRTRASAYGLEKVKI